MRSRFRRVVLVPGAAAVLLGTPASQAPASIVAPPEPELAARLFTEACWQGLHSPDLFGNAVRSSSLRFRRVEDLAPGERYAGRRTQVDYLRGTRCTIRLSLVSVAAAEDVIQGIARLTALQVSSVSAGDTDHTRTYRWADERVDGGRMSIEATFTPPSPSARPRMYPPAFTLSISAYFAPNE